MSYFLFFSPARYKPCYLGTDGSAEAEFVFFDDVAHRLFGKDVKQLMRSSGGSADILSDLAAQIGQKYQFTINVTSRAFHSSNYSYEVKRINSAHGKQPEIPAVTSLRDKQIAVKDTPLIKHGESSAHSPSSHQLQITTTSTPPPAASPTRTPLPANDPTSEETKLEVKKTTVRRTLYKSEQTSGKETDDEDTSGSSNNDDDTDKRQHLSDSGKTRPGGGKRPPPAKKTKKN